MSLLPCGVFVLFAGEAVSLRVSQPPGLLWGVRVMNLGSGRRPLRASSLTGSAPEGTVKKFHF